MSILLTTATQYIAFELGMAKLREAEQSVLIETQATKLEEMTGELDRLRGASTPKENME